MGGKNENTTGVWALRTENGELVNMSDEFWFEDTPYTGQETVCLTYSLRQKVHAGNCNEPRFVICEYGPFK